MEELTEKEKDLIYEILFEEKKKSPNLKKVKTIEIILEKLCD